MRVGVFSTFDTLLTFTEPQIPPPPPYSDTFCHFNCHYLAQSHLIAPHSEDRKALNIPQSADLSADLGI